MSARSVILLATVSGCFACDASPAQSPNDNPNDLASERAALSAGGAVTLSNASVQDPFTHHVVLALDEPEKARPVRVVVDRRAGRRHGSRLSHEDVVTP